jgi:hypothetical protein
MPSNLEYLGFEPDFTKLHEDAAENIIHDHEGVQCMECRDESGAAYYLSLFHKFEYFEIRPHFHGESSVKLGVVQWVSTEDSQIESSLHGFVEPQDEKDPESGLYPVVVSIPDFPAVEDFELPKIVDIQICAFPLGFELHPSEESFREANDSVATTSCIPTGLFREMYSPTVMLSGIVEKSEEKINALTGERFYWILVNTYGGLIDVILTSEMIRDLPSVGSIIYGSFYLSGKLLA